MYNKNGLVVAILIFVSSQLVVSKANSGNVRVIFGPEMHAWTFHHDGPKDLLESFADRDKDRIASLCPTCPIGGTGGGASIDQLTFDFDFEIQIGVGPTAKKFIGIGFGYESIGKLGYGQNFNSSGGVLFVNSITASGRQDYNEKLRIISGKLAFGSYLKNIKMRLEGFVRIGSGTYEGVGSGRFEYTEEVFPGPVVVYSEASSQIYAVLGKAILIEPGVAFSYSLLDWFTARISVGYQTLNFNNLILNGAPLNGNVNASGYSGRVGLLLDLGKSKS